MTPCGDWIEALDAALEARGYRLTLDTARGSAVRQVTTMWQDKVTPAAAAASLIFTRHESDRLLAVIEDGGEMGGAA